jgi:AraC-like DNA-binding protein
MSDPLVAPPAPGRSLLHPGLRALGRENAVLWGRGRVHRAADVPGPLSIKWVVRGTALWETDEASFVLDGTHFLVLNDGRRYSITVESRDPVETFCVLFKKNFVEDALRSLVTPDGRLLDVGPEPPRPGVEFLETLRPADGRIVPALREIRARLGRGEATAPWIESRLRRLASSLALLRDDVRRAAARVPAVRASTREEILRRVCRARDFIEAHLPEPLDLERVARAACLSTFHFHRHFTAIFGETPHRYVVRRRLERARDLLRTTRAPVGWIALACGFPGPGALGTRFRLAYGAPPLRFRRQASEKSKIREETLLRGRQDGPKEVRP